MEVDNLNEMGWEHMFEDGVPIPEDGFNSIFEDPSSSLEEIGTAKDTIGLWIQELLMKDDDDDEDQQAIAVASNSDIRWSDLLLDEPGDDLQPSSISPPLSEDKDKKSPPSCSNSEDDVNANNIMNMDNHYYYDNNGEDVPNIESNGENDKSGDDDLELNHTDADADLLCKKRKRQLRNRDAAMRSRERKKIYVKDLEMKSRYLEAECRRLGRLLQCCCAENQMLRISLGSAYGAPMAKPESAVLLLESLLLGSLVWFMVHMCLLSLPRLLLLNQDAVPRGSVERKELESAATNGKGTKVSELWVTVYFMRSKRCRASRIKMKSDFDRAVLCS